MDYVYDLVGEVQQVTDPTGSYGFAYDNLGRLLGTTTQYAFLPGTTFSNAYSYDAGVQPHGVHGPRRQRQHLPVPQPEPLGGPDEFQ